MLKRRTFLQTTYQHLCVGSLSTVYDYVSNATGPSDNLNRSLLTFQSPSAWATVISSMLYSTGVLIPNQGHWQLAVACRAREVVYAQLISSIAWFPLQWVYGTGKW